MPNVGAILKEEITRLSRKEIRRQLAGMKKISVQSRRHVAALRRQVGILERQIAVLRTRGGERTPVVATTTDVRRKRFVAKGFRSHRARLDLSAAAYGRLVGVSAQTIYNWERRSSNPRAEQRASLVAVRGLGKREVRARLEAIAARSRRRNRRT